MNCPKCNHRFSFSIPAEPSTLYLASDGSFVTATGKCANCQCDLEFYYPLTTIEEQV